MRNGIGLPAGDCLNSEEGVGEMKIFKKFLRNESGASALEYGLIGALIAVGIMVAFFALRPYFDRPEGG